MTTDLLPPSTFESIFFSGDNSKNIRVPNYQRAFAWEGKQIDLFIGDLEKYKDRAGEYYFGHYIVEDTTDGWDLVDGQQRITTFVLFLMTCRQWSNDSSAFRLIDRFSTVSYDNDTLKVIGSSLAKLRELSAEINLKSDISDEVIIKAFSLDADKLTLSLKRTLWCLLRFHQAFEKGDLDPNCIDIYINVIMNANCSHHVAKNKSVAVNVFEMHNTRGIRLTTIEIVKAKLMQYVYGHAGESREEKVKEIQENFGKIFQMEESLSSHNFRGELSLEHLLRLHLRVIDDGLKTKKEDFHSPAGNADVDAIVKYLDNKMYYKDSEKNIYNLPDEGVEYALKMTKEFVKSVQIVSELLPAWDKEDSIVGDVMILDRDLSCQFFLLICRHLETEKGTANGETDNETLVLWERLLFTRDFHEGYYNLKGGRDDFQALFGKFFIENAVVKDVINEYLEHGFRPGDRTQNLQQIVREFLTRKKVDILNNAYTWWKHKMIYVIYKYEQSKEANIREVVKDKISVEHIFPQTWDWMEEELRNNDVALKEETEWEKFQKSMNDCINGIGNLLLITPNENTSEGNKHPKDKHYEHLCSGGTYEEHNSNRKRWEDRNQWQEIIRVRGEEIYKFMIENLIVN